ncbi:hypothetical protein, partial [Endozoicomonas sp.]|uniref:hypothetical protein n=1 Tax=Endozoicomonas sp. TaxID=1892382 RepID=UPI00383ACA36
MCIRDRSSANDWMNKIKLFVDKKDAVKGIIKEFGEKGDSGLDGLIGQIKEKNKVDLTKSVVG